MKLVNIEVKARCANFKPVREKLKQRGAFFQIEDHQIDTYFPCANGRLKFRNGLIEYQLIHYERKDKAGPKESRVTIHRAMRGSRLMQALENALGRLVVVDKIREVYTLDNVTFNLDKVKGLGNFIEIEVMDTTGYYEIDDMTAQCKEYMEYLGVKKEDLVEKSYGDLLHDKKKGA